MFSMFQLYQNWLPPTIIRLEVHEKIDEIDSSSTN